MARSHYEAIAAFHGLEKGVVSETEVADGSESGGHMGGAYELEVGDPPASGQ